jgi:L-ascorbate metabolism protein UlaG (beta-lactamase superfamily)
MRVTAIGNAGFAIDFGARRVFLDAFYRHNPRVGSAPLHVLPPPGPDDLILVTHLHGDHCAEGEIVAAQQGGGCVVAGPASVVRRLAGRVPAGRLVSLEPETAAGRREHAPETAAEIAGMCVTAFRTTHTRDHNSCLVECGGMRVFHDGDNEDTQRLPIARLSGVDALFLATWRGSGWVQFIEAVQPRHWFLMHLTEQELADARAGRYFAELCAQVPLPERLVLLGPGETFLTA